MADNTTLNLTSGGDTVRDKDRSGVKTQVVGLDINPAGAEVLGTGDATNGLDVDVTRVQGVVSVSGPATDAQMRATPIPVSNASLPLPTGASTETTLAAVNTATGAQSDAEAAGNGSVVALLKRLRTLLSGGLPAALSGNGALKVEQVVAGPTQPVSGTVTANAGTGTMASAASPESGTVYNGTTALTPKYAFANIAASQTDSQIVALVAAKKIRVLALYCVAGATATSITLQSNATAKSALLANGANGGEVLPFNPAGWFETVAGEALKATTGAGSTTGIGVVYVEV